jgi:hypothetical protein
VIDDFYLSLLGNASSWRGGPKAIKYDLFLFDASFPSRDSNLLITLPVTGSSGSNPEHVDYEILLLILTYK